MTTRPGLAVCTVTHNSADDLAEWWSALLKVHARLEEDAAANKHEGGSRLHPLLRVIAVDCASSDDSLEILSSYQRTELGLEEGNSPDITVIPSDENVGFAGGMNLAIDTLNPDDHWLLSLNPDARLTEDSAQAMIAALSRYRSGGATGAEGSARSALRVGSVAARLVRPGESPARLDACGMAWTRSWRHLDRGSGQVDDGSYNTPEEVFAGTGAGTLFVIKALRDVAIPGDTFRPAKTQPQVFNPDFHSFREDAELGLRLQRRGWTCIYEPAAVIEHRRFNLPNRRRQMSKAINYHSLKNRYLLRLHHQTGSNALRTLPAFIRDLLILAYVLLRERSSLAAYTWIWQHRRRLWQQRRWLRSQQTVFDRSINAWFGEDSRPIAPLAPTEQTDQPQ